ncbi:C3a anaphylatoxin chemotactic receptor-like [Rhinichthys klamathensis goyatoka]|uniref:C3a anaphylatoxin chemotactic receptor-like n=1 Tax=Rhinichthys klamathensis goyatoka TaxID=3034132 RepID=UPI0024B49A83|nr:C3a anaphylatoxin chemotactic receptor-like [Rhinichthys klamathensis goyatoka]
MEATSFGPENVTGVTTDNTTIQPKDSSFQIFYLCTYIVSFIVGFIGNGLVIFLTGCRMKTTVNSIWFLNLAIADFIFIISIIIIKYIRYFSLYRSIRNILSMVIDLNLHASNFFLVVISLDRCLCTWMVVWAQNKRTLFRARIICMIVWVSSIGCTIPFFIVNVIPVFRIAFDFLVGFLVPFLIIASSHIAVGVRIKRLKMGKRLRSYRVIIAVVLTFFICWFPYHVCRICLITAEMGTLSEVFWKAEKFSVYLIFLNSCLNPILYVFMCDEYKKKLKQSLLLVLETAFAEDHLDFRGRQMQEDEQNKTNTFELLDM